MKQNTPPYRRPRGRRPYAWLALACWIVGSAAFGATKGDPPDGLSAGPVIFQPWLSSDVLGDDNLFRRSDTQNPESDVETTLRAGVTASIPIRMSELLIGYEGAAFAYQKDVVESTQTHEGSVLMNLNFANHHTIVVDGVYNRGVTQRQSIDTITGDIVRQGIPLVRSDLALEWIRQVPQRPSWRTRLERVDQTYQSDEEDIPWLDFEGWNFLYEYGQPVHRRGYLSGRYSARRQDQFEAGPNPAVEGSLRREVYDAVEVGFRGLVGSNQPLYLFVGYGKLQYKNVVVQDEPTNFSGLVGNVNWRLPVGGLSNMSVAVSRRPLTSFFNTYYLINELRVRFDRRVAGISRYGFSTLVSKNRYGAPTSDTLSGIPTQSCLNLTQAEIDMGAVDIVREDYRKQIEGFWEWIIQPRMAMRITAGHNRRVTNCETLSGSYVSNSLGMSFKWGWFD